MAEYVKELGRAEVENSFISIEESRLKFFPPVGKIFNLCLKDLCLIVKINSPNKEDYRLSVPGLDKHFKVGEKAKIVKKGEQYELLKG